MKYEWRKCSHCDNGFLPPLNPGDNRRKCKACDGFAGYWGMKYSDDFHKKRQQAREDFEVEACLEFRRIGRVAKLAKAQDLKS